MEKILTDIKSKIGLKVSLYPNIHLIVLLLTNVSNIYRKPGNFHLYLIQIKQILKFSKAVSYLRETPSFEAI